VHAHRTAAPPQLPARSRPDDAWHPAPAHLRAAAIAVCMVTAAVLLRRPDALVVASPLVAIAGWSIARRPRSLPVIDERIGDATLREGEGTTWHLRCTSGEATVDTVVVAMPHRPWLTTAPASAVVAGLGVAAAHDKGATGGVAVELAIDLRSTRWGCRPLGPVTVAAASAWGSFRWSTRGATLGLITLPMPSMFDTAAPMQRSQGLVGLSRSSRPGDGTEFAGIRAFQVGDRLRRIHWPRSLREGTLHVTSTWADQDSLVVLIVDAFDDVGVSGGIDGAPSSLDVTVRATAAIAEHFLARGDRVSMRVFGTTRVTRLAPRTGRSHLRRVLDTLSMIEAGTDRNELADMRRLAIPAGALAIMLSPLVSPSALQRAVALARNGVDVVVVDTLPPSLAEDPDPVTALAWRIRLLERRREVRVVQEVGVPLVEWKGPGSLDRVLRDIARRSGAPRLVRR
jgi:uncharacterized protein (DUF58 family)